MAATSQNPDVSRTFWLNAPFVVVDVESSVPFGKVPLMTTVLEPFTFPIRTRL